MSSFRSNSIRKRSRGNMRAAAQQRDSLNVVLRNKVNVECGQFKQEVPIEISNGTALDFEEDINVVNTGCAFINVYDVIRTSDYYKNICQLYDQVKINAIKVDITSIDWPNASNESNANDEGYVYPKSLTVVTAWDRSGLGASQVQFKYSKRSVENPHYVLGQGFDEEDVDVSDLVSNDDKLLYCIVGNDITSYSSSLVRHLGPGSNLKMTRYLYPESFNEKSQYVSTDLLKPQVIKSKDVKNAYSMFSVLYEDNDDYLRRKYVMHPWNINLPTNPLNSPAVMFKPTLLINVVAGDGPSSRFENGRIIYGNNLKPTTFCLDFTIDVTFRGLRYNNFIE